MVRFFAFYLGFTFFSFFVAGVYGGAVAQEQAEYVFCSLIPGVNRGGVEEFESFSIEAGANPALWAEVDAQSHLLVLISSVFSDSTLRDCIDRHFPGVDSPEVSTAILEKYESLMSTKWLNPFSKRFEVLPASVGVGAFLHDDIGIAVVYVEESTAYLVACGLEKAFNVANGTCSDNSECVGRIK